MSHGFSALRTHLAQFIVGQSALVDRLLIGLLTGGHLLVEGLPGLAKTTAVKALAEGVHARFKRIQFTPDLLPTDLLGNEIYHPETRTFSFQPGPLFNEIILADEINRAPAKVQSALLEAMAERQVTVAGESRPLPELFLVMATQNPLEQSGTYPLPEAQLDRFMLHVALDYPSRQDEYDILARTLSGTLGGKAVSESQLTVPQVLAARKSVQSVHCDPALQRWVVDVVASTRQPEAAASGLSGLAGMVLVGASPRGALAWVQAARALAWLDERDFISPDDLLTLAGDALRHRIIMSPKALVAGVTRDHVIQQICTHLPPP
ncbi:AAA family ATPase [Halothiobacillus diazotrophicus]|uniref:AAA family ATPase n=1 Tax=Halothiobacillus diazotrophicus TaxID=1860122 RepID=A0A191ZHP8_9GAMM|nr:MoxR family ATPase [Halothiobacillus diazotrophicus]ANJ67409.1 AAA family ATPase [Halothiobacillus diazotrophicus]